MKRLLVPIVILLLIPMKVDFELELFSIEMFSGYALFAGIYLYFRLRMPNKQNKDKNKLKNKMSWNGIDTIAFGLGLFIMWAIGSTQNHGSEASRVLLLCMGLFFICVGLLMRQPFFSKTQKIKPSH